MKPNLLGLLTVLAINCGIPNFFMYLIPEAIAVTPAQTASFHKDRDVFYLSDYGFRFVIPRDYTITPTETGQAGQPTPLSVIELWQEKDFLNRENLPETPPIIRVTVYKNAKQLPLSTWKGELSRNEERSITVAGQKAIAYSATGLYESDNVLFRSPDGRYVFRVQGDYNQQNDAIRKVFQHIVKTFTFDLVASPSAAKKWQINYGPLKSLLAASDWWRADVETRAIFWRLAKLQGRGADLLYGSKALLAQLPCEDLRTLNTLWSQASRGRFGYTAQQRLWQRTASPAKPAKTRVEQFAQTVGWRRARPLPENSPFGVVLAGTQWRLDWELNPKITAPVGHLPWVGVSSHLLGDILTEPGCGSCTPDAMYLANERYYDYVPALYSRLNQCQIR